MEPVQTETSSKKKFLIISLVIFGCVVIAFSFFKVKQDITKVQPSAPPRQIDTSLTPEQNAQIDILANLASTTPKDTPEQQAAKLDILKAPPKKITPADTTMTDEEKLRILQSLSGGTKH